MTCPPTMPVVPVEDAIEYRGFTILLRRTELEWMAVISGPQQRPSIVLPPTVRRFRPRPVSGARLTLQSTQDANDIPSNPARSRQL